MSDWPSTAFDAPALRSLDDRARAEISRVGRVLEPGDGDVVYRSGEPGDALFVVVRGEVCVSAVRRGDEAASEIRVARRGDTFGEEAVMAGAERWGTATVRGDALLCSIPVGVLVRALARSGGNEVVERHERALRRAASKDLLRTLAFSRDLPEDDVELLLDAVRWRSVSRSARIYSAAEVSSGAFLVVSGLVQLQVEHDGRVHVRAYLGRGDLFGDEEALGGEPRSAHAVALGECQLLEVERDVLRTLVDRNPGLLTRMRRIRSEREARQDELVARAAERSTQHVFHDLYRMQMARSLLAIDLDSCVRCGHCAWACAETHAGVARLVRRGDKLVARADADGAREKRLMLPSSCQHCENPACMIDCPTGAIGRDPEGEVFIREALCTGCGACAKACPWENIQMAPRPEPALHREVAVKCDLCGELESPACVRACPSEAIARLDPKRDFGEVRTILGLPPEPGKPPRRRSPLASAKAVAVALAIAGVGAALRWHAVSAPVPGRGLPYAAGIVAALGCLGLAAHAWLKRSRSVLARARSRESAARRAARDADAAPSLVQKLNLSVLADAHVVLGLSVVVAVAVHAGARAGHGATSVLALSFWLTAVSGAVGALAYRFVPRRLSRLERKALLPEDLGREREALFDRLHRESSGQSELVKAIVEKLLVPYARSPWGPVALVASGRDLRAEERAVRRRVDRVLEGRGGERLSGLDALVRTVVELRALGARRAMQSALRFWLPLHILSTALVLALLALHVWGMTRW